MKDLVALTPRASVTFTVTKASPSVLGVPVIVPVVGLMVIPVGRPVAL